jgi:serine/threonine protein kinase
MMHPTADEGSPEAGDREQDDSVEVPAGQDATIVFQPGSTILPTDTSLGAPGVAEIHAFLSPALADDEIGRLGDYRVRRLIGRGGMGLIFLAEDVQLLRPVALKVIRPELAEAPDVAARFSREARAAAAIRHDNVVTIYQVGQARGVAFLAMEHLRGLSLHRWLERDRMPTVDLILRIGREIASGLAAAHALGMVHRDIKPANIWLEAPYGRVKILDFGHARAAHDDVQITQTGAILGTPAFMSPEQAAGDPTDASSDLFSLGCVLYRLSTGQLPFQGRSIMAVLSSLASKAPAPPRQLNPGLPEALEALVLRLLAKDPAERPASADEVVAAIRSIERQLSVERQSTELTPIPLLNLDPIDVALPRPRASIVAERLGCLRLIVGVLSLLLIGLTVAFIRSSGRPPPPATPKHPAAAPDPAPGVAVSPEVSTVTTPDPAPAEIPPKPRVAPPRPGRGGDDPAACFGPRAIGAGACPHPRGSRLGRLCRSRWRLRAVARRRRRARTHRHPGQGPRPQRRAGQGQRSPIAPHHPGRFQAQVRVEVADKTMGKPTTRDYPPYHGAGLLLWQDARNDVRLGIATDLVKNKPRHYANFESREDGPLVSTKGAVFDDSTRALDAGFDEYRVTATPSEVASPVDVVVTTPAAVVWPPAPVEISLAITNRIEVPILLPAGGLAFDRRYRLYPARSSDRPRLLHYLRRSGPGPVTAMARPSAPRPRTFPWVGPFDSGTTPAPGRKMGVRQQRSTRGGGEALRSVSSRARPYLVKHPADHP